MMTKTYKCLKWKKKSIEMLFILEFLYVLRSFLFVFCLFFLNLSTYVRCFFLDTHQSWLDIFWLFNRWSISFRSQFNFHPHYKANSSTDQINESRDSKARAECRNAEAEKYILLCKIFFFVCLSISVGVKNDECDCFMAAYLHGCYLKINFGVFFLLHEIIRRHIKQPHNNGVETKYNILIQYTIPIV